VSAEGAAFAVVFERITKSRKPSRGDVRQAFDAILAGAWTPVQIAAFAVALRLCGEDHETLAAAAEAMRAVMVPVDHGLPRVVDTCGTGGDGSGSLNVSTAATFVVAACGEPVAKHGNRSASSRSGSADVIEALGVRLDAPAEVAAEALREVGLTFLFAPAYHPALRACATARRELSVRTIFNALGPLVNPAGATHQLVGAYAHALRPTLASALAALGGKRAWVVRGADGLDEVSPFVETYVTEMVDGSLHERVVHPETFGLSPSPEGAIRGGPPEENAAAILSILRGEPHPARDCAILNAAAALAVVREIDDEARYPDLAREATIAIDSGTAREKLEALVMVTGGVRSAA